MMESRGPTIAAIICTHNRAEEVRGAVQSLVRQTLPASAFEIIVVDNGSTDGTDRVVAELAAAAGNVRYVREERIGLSTARNTGAAATSAPYVAYMDDDARAEPDWLESIVRAFREISPAPAALGGRVTLDWDGPAPTWFPPRYQSLYTWVDLGNQRRPIGSRGYIVGANMAFRRDVLNQVGGFRTDLGRHGTGLMGGEDTALIRTLLAARLPVHYEPAAVVAHRVPPERRRKRWLYRRLFWEGAAHPLLDQPDGAPGWARLRLVQYDLRVLARLLWGIPWALARGDRRRMVESSLDASARLGRLRTDILLMHPRWNGAGDRVSETRGDAP